MFSPETFMNAVFTEANATTLQPCPAGEFPATVSEIKAASGTISKGERAGEPWARLDVTWEIQDPSVADQLGRKSVKVRQGVMLDLTAEGGLDMSKDRNVNLGRLRDAVGLNQPGQPFSPNMLIGRGGRVSVQHRIDDRDGVTIFAEVRGVAPMA